jgi:uncharacterized membrane protein YkvA (DUF1232 family)
LLDKLKTRARALKNEAFAVYLAAKDSRTPWYAKVVAFITIAYALSPIDLIPDFIPVLGYLDDLLIVPAGIALAIRLIPAEVLEEAREVVATRGVERSVGYIGAGIIIIIWILAIIWSVSIILRLVENS